MAFQRRLESGKTGRWIQLPDAKLDNLGTHIAEGETEACQLSTDLHM